MVCICEGLWNGFYSWQRSCIEPRLTHFGFVFCLVTIGDNIKLGNADTSLDLVNSLPQTRQIVFSNTRTSDG